MLNISNQSVANEFDWRSYASFQRILALKGKHRIGKFVWVLLGLLFLSLFLPWTQNVISKGYVTTLLPEQRPQAIQSVISGKIEKWYVREGDLVQGGDTILKISEVKPEYFDPELIARTRDQYEAKSSTIDSYGGKVRSLADQYEALIDARDFKLSQIANKIEQTQYKLASARADLQAYELDSEVAQKQYQRTQTMYDGGLKSLSELEGKSLKYQETQAKVVAQKNKLLELENELEILRISLSGTESEYSDKLAKSESERYSAITSRLDAQGSTAKLRNQLQNYTMRQQHYYITAPQTGYITKAVKKGLGEIIKEGTDLVTIMPQAYDLAVEVYVKPMDIPLLQIGQEVRLLFDGWPAIVFGGWPNASFGTFSGEIFAIDQFVSDNGKYRIMVAPRDPEKPWPHLLRVGSGSRALVLLNDVSLGYEIWRQLNGFPPDFYDRDGQKLEEVKTKAPIRAVK